MKISNALISLCVLIVVLALIAAGTGLFYQDGGTSFPYVTVRGLAVQMYGQGLYRYDTPIPALSFKMADLVTLLLGIPCLVVSLWLYRRGSLKGGIALCGVIAYFLYNYISVAFGAAYNNLFLIYVALLSASVYAAILALLSFNLRELPVHFGTRLPRRGIGIYLIISGVLLALVWLVLIVLPALLKAGAPEVIETYTTFMTGVLDIGLVAPTLVVAGGLLLRREPVGYLLAPTLLVFTIILGVNITLGGIAQLLAGVVALGQFIGMTFSFTILTLFAIWFTVALFRNMSPLETPRRQVESSKVGRSKT